MLPSVSCQNVELPYVPFLLLRTDCFQVTNGATYRRQRTVHVEPFVSSCCVWGLGKSVYNSLPAETHPSVVVVDDFGYHYTAFHVKSSQLYWPSP